MRDYLPIVGALIFWIPLWIIAFIARGAAVEERKREQR